MRITLTDPACGLQFARRICGLYDYVLYRGRPKMPRLQRVCAARGNTLIVSRSTLMFYYEL